MGIKTIELALPVRNIKNETKIPRGRNDLVDNYTREEIEVKFIDCLYAEGKNQRTTDAHDIMVVSILKIISGIPGQSEEYMVPVFKKPDWLSSNLNTSL